MTKSCMETSSIPAPFMPASSSSSSLPSLACRRSLSSPSNSSFPLLQIDPTMKTFASAANSEETILSMTETGMTRQDSGYEGLVKRFDLFKTVNENNLAISEDKNNSSSSASSSSLSSSTLSSSSSSLLPSVSGTRIKTRSQTNLAFTNCSLPRARPATGESNKRRRSLTSQYNNAASSPKMLPLLSVSPTPSSCSSPASIHSSQSSPLPSPTNRTNQIRREISLSRFPSSFVSQPRPFRSLTNDLSPSPASPYVGSRMSPVASPSAWPLSPLSQSHNYIRPLPQPANFTFSLTTPNASPNNRQIFDRGEQSDNSPSNIKNIPSPINIPNADKFHQ